MGTELTAKLEELWDAFNSILKHGGPPTTGDIEAFTKSFNETVAISQQPPVYAMSRTELLEEAREYMGWADGEDMSELHTPTRGAMLQSLVGFAASVAPSPQAVTVEGKWISVEDRLPEPPQWVLVYARHPEGMIVSMYMIDGFDDENQPVWLTLYGPIEIDPSDVTHWMPLPSAPASTNT